MSGVGGLPIPKRTPGAKTLIADRDELPRFTSSPSCPTSWDVRQYFNDAYSTYNLVSGEEAN